MNWQNYITADPLIAEGKAYFKNTQIMVSEILECLANGILPNKIQTKYPALNSEAISAALAFAAQITQEQIFNISKLASHREVRVAGKLEAIKLNDHSFTLIAAETQYPINGFAKAIDAPTWSKLLGQNVVVSGTAHFTNDGALLILEATDIALAKERDFKIWGRVPTPLRHPFDMTDFKKDNTGIAAIYGKWPGDEVDEEIHQALKEIS